MNTSEEQMDKKKIKFDKWGMLFAGVLFAGLFIFFYFSHPIYIYDSDDWTYISYSRQALPSIKQWNPTKVLPETLMPLISEIGVRVLYPFCGDYIKSLACIFALFISAIITFYVCIALKRVCESLELRTVEIYIAGGAFLLYHFLTYNVSEINNRFIFYGGNANCYFNYIVPALFNIICVLIYLRADINKYKASKENAIKSGCLLLMIYLCINSNMFHSIILISFLASQMLIVFVKELRNKTNFFKCIADTIITNKYDFVVIIAWLISIIFESRGARAQWAAGTTLRNLPVVYCFRLFLKSIGDLNKVWLISAAFIILLAVISYVISDNNRLQRDKKFFDIITKMFIAQIITIIYLILLCAKVSSEYIQNNTVMISWVIWTMLLVLFSVVYLIIKWKHLTIVLPILLYLLIFNTVIDGRTFADNNVVWCYGTDTVKEIDDYIIDEITKADKSGMDYLELKMPVTDSYYWPLDISYAGDRIANTLFLHGIVENKIHVVIVPDMLMNERFGVGTATMP